MGELLSNWVMAPMDLVLILALLAGPVLTPAQSGSSPPREDETQRDESSSEGSQRQESRRNSTLDEARDAMRNHDFATAIEILEGIVEREPQSARAWFFLGYSLQMVGRLEEALAADIRASEFPLTRESALYNAACACSRLGRRDEAFEWLEKAVAAGFHNPKLLATDPDLDPLRKDRRFAAFLKPAQPSHFFGKEVRLLYMFEGEAAGDQFGWEGRNAGDVNGDGKADLVISAPYKDVDGANAGKIYVYSGASGELLFTRAGEPGEYFGIGIDTAGDQDGDGLSDLLVGATNWGTGLGRAYVLSGRTGKTLLRMQTEEAEDAFGWRVAAAGDWTGDGKPEYLIGAPSSDVTGDDAGRAYLYSGADGSLLWALNGEEAGDGLGSCVAAWRGCDEPLLVVGAGNSGPRNRGRVYVYRYEQGMARRVFTFEADDTGASLGRFVSILGDADADGYPDVYASDWENCARGRCTGRVYVYSGKTGKRILTLTGDSAGDGFGSGPAQAGDVDRDGCADLIVGAWKSDEGGVSAGKAYLYSGRNGRLLGSFTCRVPRTTFGFDAVGLGDLDGDGGFDFLITAAWSQGAGEKAGRAFVVAGPKFAPVVEASVVPRDK